jgi:hypothetical protein
MLLADYFQPPGGTNLAESRSCIDCVQQHNICGWLNVVGRDSGLEGPGFEYPKRWKTSVLETSKPAVGAHQIGTGCSVTTVLFRLNGCSIDAVMLLL